MVYYLFAEGGGTLLPTLDHAAPGEDVSSMVLLFSLYVISGGISLEGALATPLLIDSTAYLRAHGYEPDAQSMPGGGKTGLLAHAQEWGADLVVIGAVYRSRIRKLVMGGTTEQALMHAGMPLFLSQ